MEQKSSFTIFPAVSYAPETSLQFGAAAIWVLKSKDHGVDFERQSTISPFVLYTLKNQIISAFNLNLFTKKGNLLEGSLRYYDFPDSYFGLGNNNDPDISEQYRNQYYQIEGRFFRNIKKVLFIGAAWDIQYNSISDLVSGGMLDADKPDGLSGGSVYSVGPAFRYDTRNNSIYPDHGSFISLRSLLNYLGDFTYTSHVIDARKYFSLWNKENILAIQLQGNVTTGSRVPFYKLPQLGGDERLRGISNASLYRDRQMIYSQVEYRRPLFWRFGMTLFGGIGDVASSYGDFRFKEFKYVAGVGGRLAAIPKDKLNLRVDLGVARGGQFAIYAGISEAF